MMFRKRKCNFNNRDFLKYLYLAILLRIYKKKNRSFAFLIILLHEVYNVISYLCLSFYYLSGQQPYRDKIILLNCFTFQVIQNC